MPLPRHLLARLLAAATLASPVAAAGADLPPSDHLTLGVAAEAGHKRYGNEVGGLVDARFHGAILGLRWARLTAGPNSVGRSTLTGLVLGYGHAFGPWRAEATGGWGGASSESQAFSFGTSTSGGHYLEGRLGLDRALLGGERWALTAGLGGWYRRLTLSGVSESWREFGGGVRLGAAFGL